MSRFLATRFALVSSVSFASVALLTVAAGCRNDPVEQAIINSLPADSSPNGAEHRAGQPCLVCHDAYGGATPFAVAGTVYGLDATTKALVPAANINVTVLDSNSGDSRKACTNAAGNFYILAANWSDLTFPLTPTAAGLSMESLVGRDGSCASCHALPGASTTGGPQDPVTGASRDSAGAIVVNPAMTDPNCMSTP